LLTGWVSTALHNRFRRLRDHAEKRSFTWNVSIMLAGTAAGQAISIVLSPILTRLFTPEQFGYLSVYNSVLMTLAVVASLGFELAIPICLVEAECANLLALCSLVLAATTALCTLLIWLLSTETLAAVGVGSLSSYRYLLPVGLAWLGGYFVMVAMATRAAAFQQIATRISQGVSGPVSQILLGWLGAGTAGLVAGSIIGQASGTLLLARFVLRRKGWRRQVSWRGARCPKVDCSATDLFIDPAPRRPPKKKLRKELSEPSNPCRVQALKDVA
jgi:O-antigen/teichoic acid export membrane protein